MKHLGILLWNSCVIHEVNTSDFCASIINTVMTGADMAEEKMDLIKIITQKKSRNQSGNCTFPLNIKKYIILASADDNNSTLAHSQSDLFLTLSSVACTCIYFTVRLSRDGGWRIRQLPVQRSCDLTDKKSPRCFAAEKVWTTCTHQNVVGGGVPAQDAHTLGMAFQLDHRFCEGSDQSTIWNLPDLFTNTATCTTYKSFHIKILFHIMIKWDLVRSYHDTAILRATGNDVVIVRTKLNVQHWTCVATYSGVGHVDSPRLATNKEGIFKK